MTMSSCSRGTASCARAPSRTSRSRANAAVAGLGSASRRYLSRDRSEIGHTSGGALADGLDHVRRVLGSRDFRVLLAARLASQVAEGVFLAAVFDTVVFLPESQSTLRGFALATVLTLLPFSLVEPFVGVFVDRWARRPILVALPLVRAAFALLLLPAVGVAALTYAGTLVVFSANRLFQATATAVVPRVVSAEDEETPADARLFAANMVASVAGTVALFGGIFAGGLVASASGTAVTIFLASVAWLAASALSARLSDSLPPRQIHHEGVGRQLSAAAADLVDGFRRIAHTPAALAPVLTVAVGQFLQVIVIATTLAVITTVLGGGLLTFSGLVGAGGVGVFLGLSHLRPHALAHAGPAAHRGRLRPRGAGPSARPRDGGAGRAGRGRSPSGRLVRLDARARRHAGATGRAGRLQGEGVHGRRPRLQHGTRPRRLGRRGRRAAARPADDGPRAACPVPRLGSRRAYLAAQGGAGGG